MKQGVFLRALVRIWSWCSACKEETTNVGIMPELRSTLLEIHKSKCKLATTVAQFASFPERMIVHFDGACHRSVT